MGDMDSMKMKKGKLDAAPKEVRDSVKEFDEGLSKKKMPFL